LGRLNVGHNPLHRIIGGFINDAQSQGHDV
jgi:hypothetical protein